MSPKEIRTQLHMPRRKVAALADVCEPTVRSYELDPHGVTARIRDRLDPVYRQLADSLEVR